MRSCRLLCLYRTDTRNFQVKSSHFGAQPGTPYPGIGDGEAEAKIFEAEQVEQIDVDLFEMPS